MGYFSDLHALLTEGFDDPRREGSAPMNTRSPSTGLESPDGMLATAYTWGLADGRRSLARRVLRATRNPDDRLAVQEIRRLCARLVRNRS